MVFSERKGELLISSPKSIFEWNSPSCVKNLAASMHQLPAVQKSTSVQPRNTYAFLRSSLLLAETDGVLAREDDDGDVIDVVCDALTRVVRSGQLPATGCRPPSLPVQPLRSLQCNSSVVSPVV